MLALCTLSCCCLVSLLECFKSSHACHMCYFCSCPCIVCWNVSEALLLACLSLSSIALPQKVRHFIAFSSSPTAICRGFLFFDVKAWPWSQTDLFTCRTYLCGHTFLRCIALHCVHYGIHCDHTFPNLLQKTVTNVLVRWKNHMKYHMLQVTDHTLLLRTCYREVYGNIAHEENGWLS